MKTLREHLKESFDKNIQGKYSDGLDFKEVEGGTGYDWIYEAMKAAISEACREQREICAAHAKMGDTYLPRTDEVQYYIDKESIKNAPEPKML